MKIHPTIAAIMRQQADDFRRENELIEGYVTVDPEGVDGAGAWVATCDEPADWMPGVCFVPFNAALPILVSVGGDGDKGAERFKEAEIAA